MTMEKNLNRRALMEATVLASLPLMLSDACRSVTGTAPHAFPRRHGASMAEQNYDVVIVGGGPAGLTAALYLGRARKRVLVLDRGNPRHAVSTGVHNFLTRDGLAPAELRAEAWNQMIAYPTVQKATVDVTSLSREGELWVAHVGSGRPVSGRALLLATGVIDEHPEIDGYGARWGHSIHHCPYCHGWEMRDQPLAVLASGEVAQHMAPLLRGWSNDVALLTHGQDLPDEIAADLAERGIPIYRETIHRIEGEGRDLERIVFETGQTLERRGLFVAARQRQVPLVQTSGVRLGEDGYVAVDAFGATSLPMAWAAGDLTSRYQQVVEAAAQGARSAAMINAALTIA